MDIRDHLDHRSLDLSFLRFHWSHPDQQHSTQPAMQNLFGASRSGDSLQQLAFQAHESVRGADPMDRFWSLLLALESPSGSSSLVNTEKSAISVGFDHLVSLRASTPSPPALPELQAEGVKLDEVAHWKQNPLSIVTNAPSAQAEGPVVGCCSTGPIWPGEDAFGLNKPSFYIEREAMRHKQAAALESPSGSSSLVNTEKSDISVGFDHLVSLRASTPSPPALPELQAEGVKLDEVAHWKQNPLSIVTNAPSAQAEGPVVGCCSTGPIWPGSDAFDLKKPSFYIEREAMRHEQAAALESPSGSSSLVNTEKSDISVGFDHLVSLRASTPSPPALPELQAEGVKLDEVAHWKQNPLSIFTNAPSAQAEGPVVGCCSTGPIWPGSDAFDLKKPSFYIEREAMRHEQAAALESPSGSSSLVNTEKSDISVGFDHLVSLRASTPSPPALPELQAEGVKLDEVAHWKQNPLSIFTNAPSAQAEGPVVGCCSTGPIRPGSYAFGLKKPSFYIEREAMRHKRAAAVNYATYTWEGQLPPRHYENPVYSCKVFLGGVPWGITDGLLWDRDERLGAVILLNTFSVFGPLSLHWPGKNGKNPHIPPGGYAYLLFKQEESVKRLLQSCTQHRLQPDNYIEFFCKLSRRRIHCKNVQVIPWVISDNNFVRCPSQLCCHKRTVFVGALHRMLNAEGLAHIMDSLFGEVTYAGINTDMHGYPIGSGKVTFRYEGSYLKAVTAAFVQIKTCRFRKKIQIDPYLEDSICQICNSEPGPFFCRAQACFKYHCRSCWHSQHSLDVSSKHQPLMRDQMDLNTK
ncbi:cytoplasmic polyadenylation element-binding protein 1-like isoform X13 [Ctenopharyngodon idella]|uniref:cytoplasmic polyadenylation element-binding protein 1-like isoform X10 n=1 Tax=Ctenopharyngodon idella TaxID=7959 RepID=UPI0022305081|nr:cytoplasmic polyadenylation element-binding protein 1-like isoform X10 [Ctenopharyngodon idella]XP_051741281.1 cytoplasmic polyadenylation element-binding protein 1-like isoform X11 [Ctenopharyngodon idella]XP_051741284.1 cytoplasmic polyadenylation element-binding protein 1-like isoform X13 [Ctenopharyngodon idella]